MWDLIQYFILMIGKLQMKKEEREKFALFPYIQQFKPFFSFHFFFFTFECNLRKTPEKINNFITFFFLFCMIYILLISLIVLFFILHFGGGGFQELCLCFCLTTPLHLLLMHQELLLHFHYYSFTVLRLFPYHICTLLHSTTTVQPKSPYPFCISLLDL